MDKPITNGGCGKGCLNLFFWVIVIGLLIEAWQGSSTSTHVLMVLVALLVFGGLGALIVYGRRHVAAKVAGARASGRKT
jgi:hypothetical protein